MVNITQELNTTDGNVTIFAPVNKSYEKLPYKIEDIEIPTLRKWILKHFVRGYLYKKDIISGPVSTFLSPCLILIFESFPKP